MKRYRSSSYQPSEPPFGHPTLDSLPHDIYDFYLFKFLSLDDILRLKLVSKSFYSKVKAYDTLTELSFLNHTLYGSKNCRDFWFSTSKPIELRNQVDMSNLGMLNDQSNKLPSLRYLRIKDGFCKILPLKLDHLNRFQRLEVLDLRIVRFSFSHLRLPKLKALSIAVSSNVEDSDAKLIIDAPNLQNLRINTNVLDMINNQLEITHLSSIKYLKLNAFTNNVSVFENLNTLELSYAPDSIIDLSSLKKLKKVKFNSTKRCYNHAALKQVIGDLIYSKKYNLDLIFSGVKIKDISKLDKYERYVLCSGNRELKFQLKNYAELEDDLQFAWNICYQSIERKIMRLLPDRPADIFKKFTNVQYLRVNGRIYDENRLINFIKGCPNLFKLELHDSRVGQQFYDQLPDVSSLSYLSTITLPTFSIPNHIIDFKFIDKMTYLVELQVNEAFRFAGNFNLNDLKYFQKISLIIKQAEEDKIVKIIKKDVDRYTCDLDGEQEFSLEEITKLIYVRRRINMEKILRRIR